MRLGINLLLWTGHVGEEHRPLLESLAGVGYDLVEIPVMSGAVAEYAAIGGWLDELGLARTSSMAFTDPAADPVHADPVVRRAAEAQLSWQIECAAALGATKVIGPMYQTLGRFSGAGPTEAEQGRAVELLATVAPEAQRAGVTLAIEPLNRFECYVCNTAAAATALARLVDHPAVGVMVDTFHANIEEKDTCAALTTAGDALVHVHASESDRGTPGTGQVDFLAVFEALAALGYDGDVVVEAFGRAVPELAAATRIWRDVSPSPEALAREAWSFLDRLRRESTGRPGSEPKRITDPR